MTRKLKDVIFLVVIFSTLGCNFLQRFEVPFGNQTGSEQDLNRDSVSSTPQSDFLATLTSTQEGGFKPLIIRDVEFPKVVYTGSDSASGMVYLFCDRCQTEKDWQEFVWVQFSVLSADDFIPFEFDPRPYIEVVNDTEIRFSFHIWCNTKQNVSIQVRVRNNLGQGSNPYNFGFECISE
jgi:hypothetical protein